MSEEDLNDGRDLFDLPEADGVEDLGLGTPADPALDAAGLGALPVPALPEGFENLEDDLFDFEVAQAPAEPSASTNPFIEPVEPGAAPAVDELPPSPPPFVEEHEAAPAPVQAAPQPLPQPVAVPVSESVSESVSGPVTGPLSGPLPTATDERGRATLLLVAGFLVINSAIFLLAQRSTDRSNRTLADATERMTQALLERESTRASLAAGAEAGVGHVVEAETPAPAAPERGPRIDPLQYDNTHQLAVGRAKALLERGDAEEARMLLNFVLANRDRVPLSNSLREEIDYLIPLTYFEQGSAVEREGVR